MYSSVRTTLPPPLRRKHKMLTRTGKKSGGAVKERTTKCTQTKEGTTKCTRTKEGTTKCTQAKEGTTKCTQTKEGTTKCTQTKEGTTKMTGTRENTTLLQLEHLELSFEACAVSRVLDQAQEEGVWLTVYE